MAACACLDNWCTAGSDAVISMVLEEAAVS
jgi:hypothetical protein